MIPSDTVMLPRTKLIIWQKKKKIMSIKEERVQSSFKLKKLLKFLGPPLEIISEIE